MKSYFISLSSLVLLASAVSAAEPAPGEFLPGRIVSRDNGSAILAKCMSFQKNECVSLQFFYSETGREEDAQATQFNKEQQRYGNAAMHPIYSVGELDGNLKNKTYLFNLFGDDELNSPDWIRFLNEYKDSFGDSLGARVVYKTARGIVYGVTVPTVVAIDVIGVSLGSPVTAVRGMVTLVQNAKVNKLIRAIKTGAVVKTSSTSIDRFNESL